MLLKIIIITLIFDDNKKVIVRISCDNSRDLNDKLAKTFVLKAFTTEDLEIVDINTNNNDSDDVEPQNNYAPNNGNVDDGKPNREEYYEIAREKGDDYPMPYEEAMEGWSSGAVG